MSKITKKEYLKQQEEIITKINNLEELLKSLPLETEGLPQNIINHIGDTWNAAYDTIHELKGELHFLDQKWDRRNWTQQDYNEWELVSNNID